MNLYQLPSATTVARQTRCEQGEALLRPVRPLSAVILVIEMMDGWDTMTARAIATRLNDQPDDQRRPDAAQDKIPLNIRWVRVWLPHCWVMDGHGYQENSADDGQGWHEIANRSIMPIAARRSREVSQPRNGADGQRKADHHGQLECPGHMYVLPRGFEWSVSEYSSPALCAQRQRADGSIGTHRFMLSATTQP